MIEILTSPDNPEGRLPKVPTTSFCLRLCGEACVSQALFVTKDGHLGAAFKSVVVGDWVASLIGTRVPMVLRLVDQDSDDYYVVIACYIEGRIRGESLLGDLPGNYYGVMSCGRGLRGATAFMDMETRTIHQDPMTEPFLQTLQKRGFMKTPSMAELQKSGAWDILRRADLPIVTFKLI
ncbi:hypothetical protein MCOR25_000552 [Pyricularia grisea]|nr:hypothetical protein MCOR25_000552 [Pyricularia grisea]